MYDTRISTCYTGIHFLCFSACRFFLQTGPLQFKFPHYCGPHCLIRLYLHRSAAKMDFETVDILTALKINEFESKVAITASSKKEYTNIERSEALETLGIAQFYNGDYADAVTNLEKSISPRYIKLKSKKRVMVVKSLVSAVLILALTRPHFCTLWTHLS